MSYAKFDDRCDEHPKIAALSDRDFRAWFQMVLYSARNLTDGFIPTGIARQRWPRNIPTLMAARVVEPSPDGFVVHDYLEWNDSREAILKRRERAARGGVARQARSSALSSAPSRQQALLETADKLSTASTTTTASKNSTPKSLAASPLANGKQAERIALKDAIVASVGWDPSWMTKASWGEVENAAKQLHDVDADPADLPRFASLWSSHYHGIDLTPSAIAKHWPAFAAGTFARTNRGRR